MAKKNEPTPTPSPAPPDPAEKFVEVLTVEHFVDGNLADFFRKYGYNGEAWPANEVRKIPEWLAKRCIQSGAMLERADG